MIKSGYIEKESIDSSKGFDTMKNYISLLFNKIKDFNFYYSIPIQKGKDSTIEINDFISGKNGFSTEFFADKFFISGSPEGPRLLIDFNSFIEKDSTIIEESNTDAVENISNETESTENSEVGNIKYSDISSLEFELGDEKIKVFENFFTEIIPGLKKGTDLLNTTEIATQYIDIQIDKFIENLGEDDGNTQREKAINFLISIAAFKPGNDVLVDNMPSAAKIMNAYYGDSFKLVSPEERNKLLTSLKNLINTLKNCK
ncbi:MAG: hypothetical protein PHX40_01870 [Bacilli bacterium]|nr:hypothetical protein [Bacilli bacterium]